MSSTGLNAGIHHLFHTSATIVEHVAPTIGLNLKGYADNLSRNQSIKETIDEIMIEKLDFLYVSPERRLIFLLLMNMVMTHNLNSAESSVDSILETKVDISIIEKYKDL